MERAEGSEVDGTEKRFAEGACPAGLFEYLRKVRYSPQVPRPQNASADASEQEAFKKVFPSE